MRDRLRRFVEVLFGESGAVAADPDDLFAVSTAYATLGVEGYESVDRAGLCFARVDSVAFDRVVEDVATLLDLSTDVGDADYEIVEGDGGYLWVVLEDSVFDDLVTSVHVVADTLIDEGYAGALLYAAFAFERDREIYLVYNFKRGAWYPFAPADGAERDRAAERALERAVEGELDVESDESRRYALHGIPF